MNAVNINNNFNVKELMPKLILTPFKFVVTVSTHYFI